MNDYTPGQIQSILDEIGIEVMSETDTNFLGLCPFHKNNDTPAFSIDKEKGVWKCFSPICDEHGNLVKLIQSTTKKNIFETKRLIEGYRGAAPPLSQYIDDLFAKTDSIPTFSKDVLNRLYDDLWNSPGQEYMNTSRGFTDKTLAYFEIGYSKKNDMITIPLHDWEGNPVGMVGRSRTGKRFKNSSGLPTRKVLFNTHRAKKHGESVIIVESSMDAMKVHQAGFPYAIATNGSIFSDWHVRTINQYWNEIIIMTDFDDPNEHRDLLCRKCTNTCLGHNPGRALGEKMIKMLPGKRIRWAAYDYGIVYPHGAKDAGQLTEEEIRQCVNNAVSTAEYEWWKRDFELLNMV